MSAMKAIGLYQYLPIENPESLIDVNVPKPTAIGRDLLVKVMATSVNPIDIKTRTPKGKIEKHPRILGWDVAGVVEEVGLDFTLFRPGDEVYYAGSIARQGGNSEYHLVDERIVGKKPSKLNFAEAAALPLTSITAWEVLFERLGITWDINQNEGKSILIIGAAGGVGSIATQLAKLAGLTVIGTASRPESIKWAKEHGAYYVINHHEDFRPQLKSIGLDCIDYIFCLNSIDIHWNKIIEDITPQGKICSIVDPESPLNLASLKIKSVTFAWESMFTRSVYQTEDMIEQHNLLNKLADLVDAGEIKTTVAEIISPINAENLRKVHARMEAGSTIGKLVLENF